MSGGNKLPPVADYWFGQFVSGSGRPISHPLDWKRFYSFVRVCHTYRVNLDRGTLVGLLVSQGFDEGEAERLGAIYSHGRELLRTPNPEYARRYREG